MHVIIKIKVVMMIKRKLKSIYNRFLHRRLVSLAHKQTKGQLDDNLIIFESFFGRSISDNPKAIYDYLEGMNKYDLVFAVNDINAYDNKYKVVRRRSFNYYKLLRKAKIIIFNSRLPQDFIKQEGQIIIQTWHGTPLKKLVHDLERIDMAMTNNIDEYFAIFDKEVATWDYLYSTCNYTSEKMKSAFHFKKEILEIGFPRNEFLYKFTQEDIERIKKKIGIDKKQKVILYAPTYRDNQNNGVGQYYFNTTLDFKRLKQSFPDSVILLRYHYMITESEDFNNPEVINVSKGYDMNELFVISDILITDYSSVFFDYSILARPFFFYAQDIESYQNELRGFYLDYFNDLVTKPVDNTDDLITLIRNKDQYDFRAFSERYNPKTNINCLEKTAVLIDRIIGENNEK
jgi:CDP-glycerol glycerophosphotransferase